MLNERSQYAMARLLAKERVVADIRRQGFKVSHYSAKTLVELADAYIKTHREEIRKELVMRKWERRFAPMRAQLESAAQNRKVCNPSRNLVQKLCAKLGFTKETPMSGGSGIEVKK